jgi:preprotein translocase subunit YajC
MSPVQVLAISLLHGPSSLAAGLLAATKGKSTGSPILLFVLLLVGLGYFLLIRPQRQRARRAQQVNKEINVGDKVVLSSGIIGHVESFSGDNALIEIAPGTVIEVLRRAVAQRIDDVGESADDLVGDDEHEGHEDEGHADPGAEATNDPYKVPPLEGTEHDDTDEGGAGGGAK